MASADWDPGQYGRFRAERARPFWDLAALIDATVPVRSAVDLGCGTGELTVALARRLGIERITGIDRSPAMLAEAERRRGPGVDFVEGDIASWASSTGVDLVVSNAALHWVGDHRAVLARWIGSLAPGGRIAVQVPANADHPSHAAARDVAHREPFVSAMDGDVPDDPVAANVLPPEEYSRVFHELGVEAPVVRLEVYPHLLASTDDVVEWTKGSSLTRFFGRLPEPLHEAFVDAYRAELLARLGRRRPYLFTFKRILMAGQIRSA